MQNQATTLVAIDLGSSKIKGALAEKNSSGDFTIRCYAEEPSERSIIRGLVYNLEIAAAKVQSVLHKLQEQSGQEVTQVYIGLGGQSLRTVRHVESLSFDAPHEVNAEDIEQLKKRAEDFRHDRYEIIQTDSPEYFVNGNFTTSPIGVQGMKIDARYQLVVARPEMKDNISNVMEGKLKTQVAASLIAPIAVAGTFLTDDQKKLGCALVDFGGGTTTVTTYKNGLLIGIKVIPLGGENISQDLMALHITMPEAERIKCNEGSAIPDVEDKSRVEVNSADNLSTKSLVRYDIDRYIEARVQEIVSNVARAISEMLPSEQLGGGVVVTGGGATMRGLVEKLSKELKMPVEHATALLPEDHTNASYIGNPKAHLLYSILNFADQSCVVEPPAPQPESTTYAPHQTTSEVPHRESDTLYPEDEWLKQKNLFGVEETPLLPREKKAEPRKKEKTQKERRPETDDNRKPPRSSIRGWLDALASNLFPDDDEGN